MTSVRHWYFLTNNRYKQQKGPNSKIVCRTRNRSCSGEDYFLETHNIHSEEANKILIDLNLAHYKDWTLEKKRRWLKDNKKTSHI